MVFFERNRGAEPGFQFLDNLYVRVSLFDPLEVAFRFFQRGVGKFTNYYPGSKVVRNHVGARDKFERTLEQTECRLTKRFVSSGFIVNSRQATCQLPYPFSRFSPPPRFDSSRSSPSPWLFWGVRIRGAASADQGHNGRHAAAA